MWSGTTASGEPARGRETSSCIRHALRGNFSTWCHKRGEGFYRANTGYIRAGEEWGDYHPGRLGGSEEWVCTERGAFVRRSDKGRSPVFLLSQQSPPCYLSNIWALVDKKHPLPPITSTPWLWHLHPFPACWMPKWVPQCRIASIFYTTLLISLITQSCKWPNWTAKNEMLLQNSSWKAGQNCICTLTVTSLIHSVEPQKLDFPNEDALALDISRIENKLVPGIFYWLCHGADNWLTQVLLADFNDECWDMHFCWLKDFRL